MVCTECFSVSHFSSLDRKKNVVKLGGHKIVCSKECVNNKAKKEENHEELESQIVNLREQLKLKDEQVEELLLKHE